MSPDNISHLPARMLRHRCGSAEFRRRAEFDWERSLTTPLPRAAGWFAFVIMERSSAPAITTVGIYKKFVHASTFSRRPMRLQKPVRRPPNEKLIRAHAYEAARLG
jgi:hypothetical protein